MVPLGNSTDSNFTSLGIDKIPAIPTIKAAIVIGIKTCARVAILLKIKMQVKN
jgi:hypothetical protein